MEKLSLNSYAKLNLYLEVINKRKDNYHNISTVFERISLCDKITLSLRRDKQIKIISRSRDIPKDKTNLAFESAKLLLDSLGIKRGVTIKIEKNIPVGSGMGGGSSNAASVLLGLNRLLHLRLSQNQLVCLAKKVGSDVPFFIYETPFARGEAKGDCIEPLKSLSRLKLWHVLVVPKIKVSTPLIYKNWDKFSKNLGLTSPGHDVKMLTSALRKKHLGMIGVSLFNNLEPITARIYPEVAVIKSKFSLLGLEFNLMSGSGPTIMALASSRKQAFSIYRQLVKNKQWRVFRVKTL